MQSHLPKLFNGHEIICLVPNLSEVYHPVGPLSDRTKNVVLIDLARSIRQFARQCMQGFTKRIDRCRTRPGFCVPYCMNMPVTRVRTTGLGPIVVGWMRFDTGLFRIVGHTPSRTLHVKLRGVVGKRTQFTRSSIGPKLDCSRLGILLEGDAVHFQATTTCPERCP